MKTNLCKVKNFPSGNLTLSQVLIPSRSDSYPIPIMTLTHLTAVNSRFNYSSIKSYLCVKQIMSQPRLVVLMKTMLYFYHKCFRIAVDLHLKNKRPVLILSYYKYCIPRKPKSIKYDRPYDRIL